MNTTFSFKKNSYEFNAKELELLKDLINFFKYIIPNGNGSYLAMLDLDDIKFTWSPEMALNEDGVFGAWNFIFKDSVFVRPRNDDSRLLEVCKKVTRPKEKVEIAKSIITRGNHEYVYFKDLGLDQELLKFVIYLTEGEGTILSTIFHELYHKWQYNSTKLLYIINMFVFMFTGYEFSTKSKWSIEGDVRIYVDNDELHDVIGRFGIMLHSYLYNISRLKKDEADEYALNALSQLQEKNERMYEFIQKIVEKLKLH